MSNTQKPHTSSVRSETVYLIDDHPSDLLLMRRLCEDVGLNVSIFDNPSHFLSEISQRSSGCLIADLMMPEMSGLQLFEELKRRDITLTTIIISGFADVGSCRAGFQLGVFDFIEKNYNPEELLTLIQRALARNRLDLASKQKRDERWIRIEELTSREMDVAQLLAQGHALKEVGTKLNISPQTASKHRSHIFDKLKVNNEVELHRVFAECDNLIEKAM